MFVAAIVWMLGWKHHAVLWYARGYTGIEGSNKASAGFKGESPRHKGVCFSVVLLQIQAEGSVYLGPLER
jgi:hypothetical protein